MNYSSIFSLCAAILLLVGCSSGPRIAQRDYIDPDVLSGKIAYSPEKPETWSKRKATLKGAALTIRPLLLTEMHEVCESENFKQATDKAKLAECKSKADQFLAERTCFSVSVTAAATGESSLRNYRFFFDNGDSFYMLEPVDASSSSRYEDSMYDAIFGRARLVFDSSSINCVKQKLRLTSGFSIYVRAAYERGLKPIDFVWSINPAHSSSRYQSWAAGSPSWNSAFESTERQAAIEAKINRVLAE